MTLIAMQNSLEPYKTQLREIQDAISHRLNEEKNTADLLKEYTQALDTVIVNLWGDCAVNSEQYALLAIGGYGRCEWYPYSDVDILILTHTVIEEEPNLEFFLRGLWDLKLKASTITTTLEHLRTLCSENLNTLSSILDQRYLCGSGDLYGLFCAYYKKLLPFSTLDFYQKKKAEKERRHQNFGVHAFCLEPNIKEGPGGLRDVQTVLWCFKYSLLIAEPQLPGSAWDALISEGILTAEECQALFDAYFYLARIRFALRLHVKKKEDKLSLETQVFLAQRCHEEHRSFMRTYYEKVLLIQRYIQILEKKFLADLSFSGKQGSSFQLWIPAFPGMTEEDIPLLFIRELHANPPTEKEALDVEIQSLFLKIFNNAPYVYPCLKTLHLWGWLPYYLPELKFCIGLIQNSLFHMYTVDEHTLLLTAMLDKFHEDKYQEQYPLCYEIIGTIQSPVVLYLAALLHDSGKGRSEDHSIVGKQLAIQLTQRLSTLLSREEQENLIWLVEEHLLMSHVAQKRDLHDPTVLIAFAKKVKDLNRLKLLYLLTVADISATNPTLWNSWKDSLLKKLYLATEKTLAADCILSPIEVKALRKKELVLKFLEKNLSTLLSPNEAVALWKNWPPIYFLHHSVPSIVKHTTLVVRKENNAVFCFSDHPRHGHYELFIYCKDRPFLFSTFTNALEKENLNVVSADILTTEDGYALDSFYVLRDQNYIQRKLYLLERLQKALSLLEKNLAPPVFKQRFHKKSVWSSISTGIQYCQDENADHTEIEIISHDRPGLLAEIGLVFTRHQLNLEQAKITTLGQRVEDLFIVSQHKQKLSDETLKALKQDLWMALQ